MLVTGSCGFIGMHLCKSLLDDGYEVHGIDNLNSYYCPLLKKARLNQLLPYNNFSFSRIDISIEKDVKSIFKKIKPKKVVNLAAQAGVRYSLKNPGAYIQSNIVGFMNIIEACKNNDVEGLIYASSSSVYGANEKTPFSVEDKVDRPISIYAASKKANELIAHTYSHLYDLNTTGLRYFTVYGTWYRPDMAIYIFLENIINGEPIQVYNNGDMKRDFTYIDDIIQGTRASIDNNYRHEVFNLGNNRYEDLIDVIGIIEKTVSIKAKIEYLDIQPGDVEKTFANIDYSKRKLNYEPKISIEEGIPKVIEWYKSYHEIS